MKYTVKFYKGEYYTRQDMANRDKAVAYVEHHFNAGSATANYTVVIVGSNASKRSIEWGKDYTRAICDAFSTIPGGGDGVKVGGYDGRGNGNVVKTKMPAILLEPLFASNPKHAERMRSKDGQHKLAQALVDSIRKHFPNGGLIAFSVGHKYKVSNPADRGAAVAGGGTEADIAENVLLIAKTMLESDDVEAVAAAA